MTREEKNAYNRQLYLKNREKVLQRTKAYSEANKETRAKYPSLSKEKKQEYNKQYYLDNKEEILQQVKAYNEENKESRLEYQKDYHKQHYLDNKERIDEYHRNLYHSREEWERERKKEYYQNNKDVYIGNVHKRKARQTQLPSTFTPKQWQECKKYFDNQCCYCGREVRLTREHFVPITKSGGYTASNIIPACCRCNSSKNNKDFIGWYRIQEFYSLERELKILQYINIKLANSKSSKDGEAL